MVHRVLLTGANGFIGSHVLSELLAHNFSVRAVVRSASKADQVAADFPSTSSSQLDFGIVPDITAVGAFNDVVKSSPPFDTVIHTASPFLYRVIKDNREFLDPAIKGTTEVLKAIHEFAPTVTRVIITSSCAAVVNFGAPPATEPKKVYTEDDWNPTTLEQALEGPQNTAYQASKKFAEKAAWDFIKNSHPNFDVVTLTPPMVYGPLRHTITSPSQLNESNARIYNLFMAPPLTFNSPLPPNGMPVYTDVRDLATAHILAATVPEAGNNRFVICAGQVSSAEIAGILRHRFSKELEARTPSGEGGLPEGQYECSSEKARKVLGLTFRSKEETFGDLGEQLLKLEK